MSRKDSILVFLIVLSAIFMFFKFISFGHVQAQPLPISGTTANVTVTGYLDNLTVQYFPVNFTVGPGLMPGISDYPKVNEQPFLNVSTGPLTNVKWNISINGTGMVSEDGHMIPVQNIFFNSTWDPLTKPLSNVHKDIAYNMPERGSEQIYFYLYIPVGQANGTYTGDIWIYAWSEEASPDTNNNTWIGLGNTSVAVKVTFGIEWTLKPIEFGVLNPGTIGAKAIDNEGWPTNITVDHNTNVFVDLYINGTNLIGPEVILSKNITYSNSTLDQYTLTPDLSQSYAHTLNLTRPLTSTYGDFSNWGYMPNNTDVFSYWNITIPKVVGGEYTADVTAKIVVTGDDPDAP